MRAAYWELRLTGKNRNPLVLGRKHCSACGRWRHACDFDLFRGVPRATCAACRRAAQRRYYANRTPEQIEHQREYERIWREAHRRMAGKPERRRNGHAPPGPRGFVPAGPIAAELRYWSEGYEALARASGVPARTIYRLRYGESVRVEAGVADRLALALGLTASLVYGEAWAA